ncbi:MAG: hypothetical protein LBH95_04715 [Oscillospiraceae bacterium]|nr:hypothetical protein [Oscillospiraceae bacterium]
MEKSKFGFKAVVYPLLVLFCVLFSSIWVGLAIFGFVLIMEQSEKISKQTLHSVLYFFVWPLYRLVTGQLMKFYNFATSKVLEWTDYSSGFSKFTGSTRDFFGGLDSVLYVAFLAVIIMFGILPLLAGKASKLPGMKKVDALYGAVTKAKAETPAE